jgi:hypothetical protein
LTSLTSGERLPLTLAAVTDQERAPAHLVLSAGGVRCLSEWPPAPSAARSQATEALLHHFYRLNQILLSCYEPAGVGQEAG